MCSRGGESGRLFRTFEPSSSQIFASLDILGKDCSIFVELVFNKKIAFVNSIDLPFASFTSYLCSLSYIKILEIKLTS